MARYTIIMSKTNLLNFSNFSASQMVVAVRKVLIAALGFVSTENVPKLKIIDYFVRIKPF